ncbi:hypothetical protein HanPSC8_Chr02g0052381 [Helianthus annuus]|nr:hypothetical protein HanPSC8_Chr02g0052381 [Helianthus annuus]
MGDKAIAVALHSGWRATTIMVAGREVPLSHCISHLIFYSKYLNSITKVKYKYLSRWWCTRAVMTSKCVKK